MPGCFRRDFIGLSRGDLIPSKIKSFQFLNGLKVRDSRFFSDFIHDPGCRGDKNDEDACSPRVVHGNFTVSAGLEAYRFRILRDLLRGSASLRNLPSGGRPAGRRTESRGSRRSSIYRLALPVESTFSDRRKATLGTS